MKSSILQSDKEIQAMRDLITALPQNTSIPNFEEMMQLNSIKANTRLWMEGNAVIAFALIDDFNNFRFEVHPEFHSTKLENEIVAWGVPGRPLNFSSTSPAVWPSERPL